MNEGVWGDTLLEIVIHLNEADMDEYCWHEDGKPYREYLVPAATINSRSTVRLVEE